jgi:hypothetical protein
MPGNGKPKPAAGWGDEDQKRSVQPSTEDRLAKLESEHAQLLVVLDRHGINLP